MRRYCVPHSGLYSLHPVCMIFLWSSTIIVLHISKGCVNLPVKPLMYYVLSTSNPLNIGNYIFYCTYQPVKTLVDHHQLSQLLCFLEYVLGLISEKQH